MSRTLRVLGTAGAAGAIVLGTAATASAQPILTPQPGGVIKIESPPGEWWKCSLYSAQEPFLVGAPPVVTYPNPSPRWAPPADQQGAGGFSTPPAYAQFNPGQDVVADCVSQYLPIIYIQQLKAGQ